MEPNSNNQAGPNFNLPLSAPQEGTGVNPNVPVPETNQQTEHSNMELPSASSPVAPAASQAVTPMVPLAGQPTQPPVQLATQQVAQPVDDSAMAADDSDLIEKAWVLKAKAIVEQTKDDPYKQNNEINKVKASYIKKRYNKDVKLNEEPKQWQSF